MSQSTSRALYKTPTMSLKYQKKKNISQPLIKQVAEVVEVLDNDTSYRESLQHSAPTRKVACTYKASLKKLDISY